MAKAKGSKKTGGRKKGTPNRKTMELKDYFESINLCLPERIMSALTDLEVKDQVSTMLKLMEFIYPKRKPDTNVAVNFQQRSFTDVVKELDI